MQEPLVRLPAEKNKLHVVIGIPTFGAVSIEFATYLRHLGLPMNTSFSMATPKGKPVDEARNEIVEYALKVNAKYIFFMDDDVIGTDGGTLLKLMSRDADGSCPIVSGVYCVKQNPPMPLIFMDGHPDGYRDWNFGDFFECQATGMGCTLIRTDIFKNIPKPWFKTQRQRDPNHPVGKLFDTCTEDIWFCINAAQAGYRTWVDTTVQNMHLDINTGNAYMFHPGFGKYGWVDKDGKFWWFHTAADRAKENAVKKTQSAAAVKHDGPVKFDLGAGDDRYEGFIRVDFNGTPDEKGDIKNIDWLREKYGLADEVFSMHALEHLQWPMALPVLRNWVSNLKPGGKLRVGVPDLEWCVKDWLEAPEDDPEKYMMKMAKIFGLCTVPGEEHKGGFTIGYLEKLAAQLPIEGVKVTRDHDKEKSNQPTLWLEATKIKSDIKFPESDARKILTPVMSKSVLRRLAVQAPHKNGKGRRGTSKKAVLAAGGKV